MYGIYDEPVAKSGTKFRVVGPVEKNGMQTWVIYSIGKGGVADIPVTSDLFSVDEVQSRLKDLLKGVKTIWFGSTPFKKKIVGE
ncbi:MAG: hypothetical protein ACTSYJ_07270 [Candidatus Thorarchaeota archaeon]